MLESVLFYPTLGFNLMRNFFSPVRWAWYNRVDEYIVLGALPFKSMVQDLVENENIGGVVCCTEEYEQNMAWQAMDEESWKKNGVRYFGLPMTDFTGSAPRAKIDQAIEFIKDVSNSGKSVYVHCKAGRTRSAMLVSCYLMKKNDWYSNVAFEYVKLKRPQAVLGDAQWRSINEFRRFLDHKKGFL